VNGLPDHVATGTARSTMMDTEASLRAVAPGLAL